MGNEKSFRKYTGSRRKPNERVCPLLEREEKPLAGDTIDGFFHQLLLSTTVNSQHKLTSGKKTRPST